VVVSTPEENDAFEQALWRQTLARAIRQARQEARGRKDPVLKQKLRRLYHTLWGGRRVSPGAG